MMTAQLVALVLMNVRLKQSLRVIFTKLILMFAPTVDHAQMYARLKQFTQHKQ